MRSQNNKKLNFVLRRASNYSGGEVISVGSIDELLGIINKYGYPIIIERNIYLDKYDNDREEFKKQYIPEFVKKVKYWKRRKAYYVITIYDDYIE